MELSEHERRQLQELEAQLLVQDPRLASSLSVHQLPLGATAVLAVAGLFAGVLVMGIGVWRAHALGIAIAMVGFLVLVFSTAATVDRFQALRGRRQRLATPAARP